MGAIRLTAFRGMQPRTSPRLLQQGMAQSAVNCRLTSGELVPLTSPAKRYTSAKAPPLLALHRITENGESAWLTWPYDVDVVKAPLFGTAKWCFTGDGAPRITTLAMATQGGGSAFPNTYYALGVHKPVTKPTVTPSGGVGATVSRAYLYTFNSAWAEEGGASPASEVVSGKVDGTWAISGMDATPPNSGSGTASGQVFTDTLKHWLRVGEEVIINATTRTVTAVTTLTFTVDGAAITGATAWTRKAPWNTATKRLYRSAGTTGAYQLVAEGITGTTYNDTLSDANILGDELISTTWEPPPVTLRGLFTLPSGALGGFDGNRLCFSEPNQPHAWPPEYQLQTAHPIVAAESFGSGVGVATTAFPYIVTGVEPGQMAMQDWKEAFPCVSKRSMVGLGDTVLYASTGGKIAISSSGVSVWSLPYFTEIEFRDLQPATMISALMDRQLYVHYQGTRALVFNLNDGTLSEAHFRADELYADNDSGTLYFTETNNVWEFDPPTGVPMQQSWKSAAIPLPKPDNMGAAKISFDLAIDPADAAAQIAARDAVIAVNAPMLATGQVRGAWNTAAHNVRRYNASLLQAVPELPASNNAGFTLYSNGKVVFSRTITDERVFRLPSGFKTDEIAVEVFSQCRINAVEIGSTAQALSQS